MPAIEWILAVREHDQRRDVLGTTSEKTQYVERGLVGEVDVLEHEDRRPPGVELLDQRAHDLEWRRASLERVRETAAERSRDVEQRSQRSRREQLVALAAQNL